jgi:hypothetical protein
MDASYPTAGTSQLATFKTTFTSAVANFHWQEWSVRNGSSEPSAKNINHKVEDLGTKASPAAWALSVNLSIS